jgi:hypothetical protein
MAMISVRTRNTCVAAIAILSIACGGDDSATPAPAAPAEPAPEAKKTSPAPPTAPTQVSVDGRDAEGNPVRFSGTDSEGNPFEARFGEDANVPSGFPDDVPIYPGASPTAAMTAAGEGVMVTLRSTDEQQAIFEFYEAQLVEQGWSITARPSFGGQLGLEASKDSRKVTVRVSGVEGESHLSLMVNDAG